MNENGYVLSEALDEAQVEALADALGMSKDEVLSELMAGLSSEYPDSGEDDIRAYAEAVKAMLNEGWLTPDNLDSELEGETDDGVDSNGNEVEDEEAYGEGFGDEPEDDSYEDEGEEDSYEDEEEDSYDPPSDKKVKDKKASDGCVSDETVKNIVGALNNFLY